MNIPLLKRLGNIDQLAGVRLERLESGNGVGSRIARVWNAAGLSFSAQPDKCLDLYDFTYKGVNIAFHSKNGLSANSRFLPAASEFFSYWSGGMLATCGLDNTGGADDSDPSDPRPIHGRIGYAAADSLALDASWQGDDYVLTLSGRMRESRLYGRDLELRRRIQTALFSSEITITDTVTNHADAAEPIMLLYHFNFGYPLLDERSRFFAPRARTSAYGSIGDIDYAAMRAPADGAAHQTFLHEPLEQGETVTGLYNPALRLAAYLRFDSRRLPYLMEWTCMKSHDYVLGIEPANCPGDGRKAALDRGAIPLLGAYESMEYSVTLGVAEGDAAEALGLGER